jgi:hypothetical protein
MDTTFLTGSAAFLAAITVFVGSVFLLMALVMGARLAYMITATVTLAFVFMMALVWSYGTPLGPVGQLPEWHPVDIGTDAASLGFGPAADYPQGWEVPEEGDAAASELQTAATDYLDSAITDGKIDAFEDAGDAVLDPESVRLIEQDGTLFGGATMTGVEGTETEDAQPVIAVMEYDPGNPSGTARRIAAGTFVVLAAHLVLLSRMEKKAARKKQQTDEEA